MDHRRGLVDERDARVRAAWTYRQWHPLFAAVEVMPGEWHMVASTGETYGVIVLLEIGGERGYRAVTWAEVSSDRRLIGYYRTLRAAVEKTHRRWLSQHGNSGGINGS
ncbi:hypothetical protein BH11ACT3_BH11ACT3_14210 [soil metagenome]